MLQFYKDLKQKHSFKIVIIGDTGSGKTSILNKYVKDDFPKETYPTIAGEYYTKSIMTKDKVLIKAQIWDTTGQERYDSLSNIHFSKCKGILLVYDVTNQKSFQALDRWILKLKKFQENQCTVMLVGNKIDLVSEVTSKREVLEETGRMIAKENKFLFSEVSAKSNKNIVKIFEDLLNEIYLHYTCIPSSNRDELNKRPDVTSIETKTESSSYCFCV
jgi:small GTP-binding protein